MKMLENISTRGKECQFLAPKLHVFDIAVPYDDHLFNSDVIAGIIYIQGRSVLHVVDSATHFQAARFAKLIIQKKSGVRSCKCGVSSTLVHQTI